MSTGEMVAIDHSLHTEGTVLPFFVYGTARQHNGLWWMVEPMCEAVALASAPFMSLLTDGEAAYPWMVRNYKPDTKVWGDLLLLRNGPRLEEFVKMEQGAGYTLEGIKVDHHMKGVGDIALAFLWWGNTAGMKVIQSGSWLARNYLGR